MTRAPLIHGLVCVAVFAALLPAAAGTAPAAKTTVRVSPVDLGRLTEPLVDTFFVGSHDTRRKGACHRRWQCNGIDLFAGLRAPVRAPFSGYVTPSWNKLGGRTFTILSTDGTLQAYGAHMASFTSLAARYVDAGDSDRIGRDDRQRPGPRAAPALRRGALELQREPLEGRRPVQPALGAAQRLDRRRPEGLCGPSVSSA